MTVEILNSQAYKFSKWSEAFHKLSGNSLSDFKMFYTAKGFLLKFPSKMQGSYIPSVRNPGSWQTNDADLDHKERRSDTCNEDRPERQKYYRYHPKALLYPDGPAEQNTTFASSGQDFDRYWSQSLGSARESANFSAVASSKSTKSNAEAENSAFPANVYRIHRQKPKETQISTSFCTSSIE